MTQPHGIEIERKYLLRQMPAIPSGALSDTEVWHIEQGYLPNAAGGGPPARLRRAVLANGDAIHTFTLKRGQGVVRQEQESVISRDEFQHQWPRTAGRRIKKIRYRIREDQLIWEIDHITEPITLWLAEVELPDAQRSVSPPAWLQAFVIREVTDDPTYTNAAIAFQR